MRETRDSKGRVRIDNKHSIEIYYEDPFEAAPGVDTMEPNVRIIKSTNDQPILDNEPRILFRGRDKLAIPMLLYYIELCKKDGATDFQLESMNKILREFVEFMNDNPRIMKQPGITKGL